MGSLCSPRPPPKIYDPTPDPATGLTEKDRELILESWKDLANKYTIKPNAVEFFILLFETYPYMQNYFGLFKGKQSAELRASPKMRAHAASVFYFISSYVENMDDSETFVGLAEKMAVAHIGRGIMVDEFEKMRPVFTQFLQNTLGPKSSPELEEAWDRLFKAQNTVYLVTQEDLGSSEGGSGAADSGSEAETKQ